MTGVASGQSAAPRPGAGVMALRVLLGVAVAAVGWWGTYVAAEAYDADAFSLGPKSSPILILAPVMLFLGSAAAAVLLLRWRSAAFAASAAAVLGLALGAYATFTGNGAFLLVDTGLRPGQGLTSGNPLLGVVNDLGNAVIASVFHAPLLLLSATWFAIALSGRTAPRHDASASWSGGWRSLWKPFAGAALVLFVIWLRYVAGETMLARAIDGSLSPVDPAMVVLLGLLSTALLIRSPRAAIGAGVMTVILLAISIASGTAPALAGFAPRAWNFSSATIAPALFGSARSLADLVLAATWIVIAADAVRLPLQRRPAAAQPVATSS